MNKFTKTVFSLLGAALICPVTANAELTSGECYFGSYDRLPESESTLISLGHSAAGTVAVGYKIPGTFAGARLEGVMVPLLDTTALDDLKAWASTALAANTKSETKDDGTMSFVFTPDVSKGFKAQTSKKLIFTEVRFDTPVTVPESGLYMGYSFNVKAATDNYSRYPILSVKNPTFITEFPLMAFSSKYSWSNGAQNPDTPDDKYASIVLGILSNVPENGAYYAAPNGYVPVSPDTKTIVLPLVNMGSAGISSVEYSVDLGGNTYSNTLTLDPSSLVLTAKQIGVADEIEINLPEHPKTGTYGMKVNVTKVNGKANQWIEPESEVPVKVVSRVATKRPIVEELTSVQCVYCTRGLYGMEVLSRKHPESIIISYHSINMGYDPMVCSTTFPITGGLPTGMVDRYDNVKNYEDTESAGFAAAWEAHLTDYAPADISVKAGWTNEDKTAIRVTSTLNFVETSDNVRYRLDYALLQDGMTGTPAAGWVQKNYYSGAYDLFSEPEWNKFADGGSTITGLVYDDVCVGMASRGLKGITASVPTSVEADKDYTHSYTFDLSKCVLLTPDGASEISLIQDKSKLKVVAVLIDVNSGKVVNAALVRVPETVGVNNIGEEAKTALGYYDLSGRRVDNPQNGIYIVRYSDGSVEKRVVR